MENYIADSYEICLHFLDQIIRIVTETIIRRPVLLSVKQLIFNMKESFEVGETY